MLKMKIVKYKCKQCGYSEEFTNRQIWMRFIGRFFLTTIMALGIVLALYIVLVGPITAVGSITTSLMMKYSDADDVHDELRDMGTTWTRNCEPFDQRCFTLHIFANLKHIPYTQASLISPLQTPLETYRLGGDCKNTAILFTSIMTASGAKSVVVCSAAESHCVSAVPEEEYGKFYVVDLTTPRVYEMELEWDVWDYRRLGKVIA